MSSRSGKGEEISRRDFIKGTGAGALAIGTGSILLKGLRIKRPKGGMPIVRDTGV
jgi:hypothetical protein